MRMMEAGRGEHGRSRMEKVFVWRLALVIVGFLSLGLFVLAAWALRLDDVSFKVLLLLGVPSFASAFLIELYLLVREARLGREL